MFSLGKLLLPGHQTNLGQQRPAFLLFVLFGTQIVLLMVVHITAEGQQLPADFIDEGNELFLATVVQIKKDPSPLFSLLRRRIAFPQFAENFGAGTPEAIDRLLHIAHHKPVVL